MFNKYNLDFFKKIFQPKLKPEIGWEQIQFASIEQIIQKQTQYQKNRISLEREKYEKQLESQYNDFYNYSSFVNGNIQTLEKGYKKFVSSEKRKLLDLESQFKNLKITKELYESQSKTLEKHVENSIAAKRKALDKRIALIQKTHDKKHKQLRAKIETYKKDYEEFLDYLEKDAEVKIANLKKELQNQLKSNETFYTTRQTKMSSDFDSLKSQYLTTKQKLKQDYDERKISLDHFEAQNNKFKKQFSSQYKELQTQANKHVNKINFITYKTQLARRFEKERLIHYGNNSFRFLNNSKLIIFFIFISIITGILFKDQYYTTQNWFNAIFGSNIQIGFIALGETLVILTGGIDLSVGSLIGFGGTIYMALVYVNGVYWLGSMFIMFLCLIIIGYVSGWLISRFNIPPFIITLAGLLTLRGAVAIILKGVPISASADPLLSFLTYNINGQFPVAILVFIVVAFLLIMFIKFSKFGRYVYAVGDNIRAAKYSGINTKNVLNMVYLLSAFLAGFGALVATAQVSSVSPQTGQSLELDAITAVALGGTSFMGGRGGLVKTLIGWFSISLLINALGFWGVNSNYQFVVKGIVIVIALMVDRNFNLFNRIKRWYYKVLSYL